MDDNVLRDLYSVVEDRKKNPQEGSYTCYLFDQGIDKILKKVGEECSETIIAAKNGRNPETVYEISDLLYHLVVMMSQRDTARRRAVGARRQEQKDRQSEKIPHDR